MVIPKDGLSSQIGGGLIHVLDMDSYLVDSSLVDSFQAKGDRNLRERLLVIVTGHSRPDLSIQGIRIGHKVRTGFRGTPRTASDAYVRTVRS